jgi:hypothetical protein
MSSDEIWTSLEWANISWILVVIRGKVVRLVVGEAVAISELSDKIKAWVGI